MTGQQLIDLIRKNELEDFEIKFSYVQIDKTPNAPWGGYNQRKFSIDPTDNYNPTDIGYSDKIFVLSLVE